MADFNIAYAIVKRNEGGYLNDPRDHGGETYKGIARRFHPDWQGWTTIDAYKRTNGPISNGAFIPSTELDGMVGDFYEARFRRFMIDRVKSQEVANIYFDFIILAARAVATMQETLNMMGNRLKVDNAMGPMTLAAINRADPKVLHDLYKKQRIAYHELRVAQGKVNAKWLKGWLLRTARFPDLATAKKLAPYLMAAGAGVFIIVIVKNKNKRKK